MEIIVSGYADSTPFKSDVIAPPTLNIDLNAKHSINQPSPPIAYYFVNPTLGELSNGVGQVMSKAELDLKEKSHLCRNLALAYYRAYSRYNIILSIIANHFPSKSVSKNLYCDVYNKQGNKYRKSTVVFKINFKEKYREKIKLYFTKYKGSSMY